MRNLERINAFYFEKITKHLHFSRSENLIRLEIRLDRITKRIVAIYFIEE